MQAGDQVMVFGGKHHLRHGQVLPGYESERVLGGIAAAPDGFAVVNFYNKGGELLKGHSPSGCQKDLINMKRLAVFPKVTNEAAQ